MAPAHICAPLRDRLPPCATRWPHWLLRAATGTSPRCATRRSWRRVAAAHSRARWQQNLSSRVFTRSADVRCTHPALVWRTTRRVASTRRTGRTRCTCWAIWQTTTCAWPLALTPPHTRRRSLDESSLSGGSPHTRARARLTLTGSFIPGRGRELARLVWKRIPDAAKQVRATPGGVYHPRVVFGTGRRGRRRWSALHMCCLSPVCPH